MPPRRELSAAAPVPDEREVNDVVVVKRFADQMEAEVAKVVLDAHGIPAMLLRDDAGGMIPALHLLFQARLVVHREHAEEALRLLESPPEAEAGADPLDHHLPDPAHDADEEGEWEGEGEADDDEEERGREPWRR